MAIEYAVCCRITTEPNVIAHVQLKESDDVLTPSSEEVVRLNVQESIEQTARIEKVSSSIQLYQC